MGNPVVHFEVTGKDPEKLRGFYGELFGWQFDTSSPVAPAASEAGNYGFVERNTTGDGTGIPGGVGGGAGYRGHAIFYVGFLTSKPPSSGPRASAGHARWARKPIQRQISSSATSPTPRVT
jgi:hypothetical protein